MGAYRSGWKNENDHGGAAFLEVEVEFMLTQIAIVLAAQTKERVLSPEVLIALIGVFGTLAAALISSWLTSRSSLKRETLQWQRTVREQQRQEALSICEDYLTMTTTMVTSTTTDHEAFLKGLNRVQLHTSARIAEAAAEFYRVCAEAQKEAKALGPAEKKELMEAIKEGRKSSQECQAKFDEVSSELARKRNSFIAIVQEEYDQTEIF